MAGLVEIRGVTKRHARHGLLAGGSGAPAVDDVSLTIQRGEVFGLVGESGCGKTTLARAVLHLDPPTAGEIVYDGMSLGSMSRRTLRAMRRRMQIVFQDPHAALDPRMRIRDSMEEGLRNLHVPRREREARVADLLSVVGIPAENAARWPHEFSGGQKQRIVIARALSVEPEFLVLDEPVSNLDVSIQAQIVNLLRDLRGRYGLTYLFISHDLHLVAYLADRIGVMYRGRLVECAPTVDLMERPLHPYTERLFASVPGSSADPSASEAPVSLPERGETPDASPSERDEAPASGPSPARSIGGCPYRDRCPWSIDDCARAVPVLRSVGAGHSVACIRAPLENVARGAGSAPFMNTRQGEES
ncbi:MAG TPA: ABC transporter ATP-binding protein [Spirochaetia bacterium]